jgi:carbamoyl-phosphate synthase large subunit
MTRVLVTGAGGAAGIAVLGALHQRGTETVGGDPDPLAAGRQLADRGIALPRACDPGFGLAVVDAAREHEVDAVICTVAEEMIPLADVVETLDHIGSPVWIPPADVVGSCIDKAAFAQIATDAGLPVPSTAVGHAGEVPGPWVVKPRFGRGSRDVQLVDAPEDLGAAIRRTPEPIVQTRCEGQEFTADVLVARDGTVAGVVPRWRLETKGGISTKGVTFSSSAVTGLVHATVAAFHLEGACNVQGFVDAAGAASLVEVNPRFSGGLPLSLAAGADLVGELLRATLGHALRPQRLLAREGVTMTRYFADVFFDPSADPRRRA